MAKVLIVEDQPSVATVVRYHIESAGFDPLVAGDAEEGWRVLLSEYPDAAVVDIKLPGADGWSLLEKMRSDGRYMHIPAIVLTGLLEQDVVDRAAALGCQYLSKPFAASALVGKLQTMIKSAQLTPMTVKPAPPPPGMSQGVTDPDGKVDLVALRVVILLGGYEVEGTVHMPPELGRFSDAFESLVRDPRSFLPVTDARVTVHGSRATAKASFLQVRKSDIQGIFPKE